MKNRYPFLMLDGITELDTLKWANGYKNFSINEWYFQGHFSDNPIVPGAILMEAMIETFIMVFLADSKYGGMEAADSKILELKFLKKVKPGDRLDMKAVLESFRRGVAKGYVKGYVNEELACECILTVCIPELMVFTGERK
jgi:3-hydroxyacyl-[acyl-carrier-protein] dehydratase